MAASVNDICVRPEMILTRYFVIYQQNRRAPLPWYPTIPVFDMFCMDFGVI
jgi:hypothetical protein